MIKGGELANRQVSGQAEFDEAVQCVKGREPPPPAAPAEELAEIAARIDAARTLKAPAPRVIHCGHCWGEGRDAAIRAIEGGAS